MEKSEKTIKVIGLADDVQTLPAIYRHYIEKAEVLVGGERQLSYFPEFAGDQIIIRGNLSKIPGLLQAESREVVVLASGDPMFFGIGSFLARSLNVEIFPAVSSLQLAFARARLAWQDALLLSAHGRELSGLAQKLDGQKLAGIFTDEQNHPGQIASYLLQFGLGEYEAFVGENLGLPEEKTAWYSLPDLAAKKSQEFCPLNILILKQVAASPRWPLGIPDQEFCHRSPDKALITKREVRVLTLAAMKLLPDSVVWDIGTCTGSVAIEAARIAREGAVYAVEKNPADLANCRSNMQKFRTDFTLLEAKAPAGLESFPDPDSVFIGGSGGELKNLLAVCCQRLKPAGTIVMNAATFENLALALSVFQENNFATEITLAQISRSQPVLDLTRLEALNPVYIISATRKANTGPTGENQ